MAAGQVVVEGFFSLQVRFSRKSRFHHQILFKEHKVREVNELKPQGRTLFVVNVPPYCDEECLKRLFADCGPVDHVFLHKKPTTSTSAESSKSTYFPIEPPISGFKVAYVVFNEESGLRQALSLRCSEPRILCADDRPLLVGVEKWCKQYRDSIPNVHALKQEIDSYMAEYDQKAEEERKKAKEMDGVPDEEGWITVTRHGRRSVLPRTEAVAKKLSAKEKKKRSKKELLSFYTFQIRQSKMDHIMELRKKFEEDKRRIAILKASRKFKPF